MRLSHSISPDLPFLFACPIPFPCLVHTLEDLAIRVQTHRKRAALRSARDEEVMQPHLERRRGAAGEGATGPPTRCEGVTKSAVKARERR